MISAKKRKILRGYFLKIKNPLPFKTMGFKSIDCIILIKIKLIILLKTL